MLETLKTLTAEALEGIASASDLTALDSHVVSSTLCVDRSLYASWPLHAEDADGIPCEIDAEPGELVLYESARIAHGRPVPLNGRVSALALQGIKVLIGGNFTKERRQPYNRIARLQELMPEALEVYQPR